MRYGTCLATSFLNGTLLQCPAFVGLVSYGDADITRQDLSSALEFFGPCLLAGFVDRKRITSRSALEIILVCQTPANQCTDPENMLQPCHSDWMGNVSDIIRSRIVSTWLTYTLLTRFYSGFGARVLRFLASTCSVASGFGILFYTLCVVFLTSGAVEIESSICLVY